MGAGFGNGHSWNRAVLAVQGADYCCSVYAGRSDADYGGGWRFFAGSDGCFLGLCGADYAVVWLQRCADFAADWVDGSGDFFDGSVWWVCD